MPLFLMGCFPVDFQEGKRPLETKSRKRPIKVGERPIKEGKRPVKGLMGCFWAPQPWRKTAPLKRPIKRSMKVGNKRASLSQLGSCFWHFVGRLAGESHRTTRSHSAVSFGRCAALKTSSLRSVCPMLGGNGKRSPKISMERGSL